MRVAARGVRWRCRLSFYSSLCMPNSVLAIGLDLKQAQRNNRVECSVACCPRCGTASTTQPCSLPVFVLHPSRGIGSGLACSSASVSVAAPLSEWSMRACSTPASLLSLLSLFPALAACLHVAPPRGLCAILCPAPPTKRAKARSGETEGPLLRGTTRAPNRGRPERATEQGGGREIEEGAKRCARNVPLCSGGTTVPLPPARSCRRGGVAGGARALRSRPNSPWGRNSRSTRRRREGGKGTGGSAPSRSGILTEKEHTLTHRA